MVSEPSGVNVLIWVMLKPAFYLLALLLRALCETIAQNLKTQKLLFRLGSVGATSTVIKPGEI
jgi:hypothetical protein